MTKPKKAKPGRPVKNYGRSRKAIGQQLTPVECTHKRVIIQTNRKGDQFKECDDCGAFLGMV